MKHISLHMPVKKLNSFKYVTIEEYIIVTPSEHKKIVRKRIEASNADPARLLNWDKAKHQLKFKNT